MIAPFPLYVDEISSDRIKATVSDSSTIVYNLRTMMLDMPAPDREQEINGICILPIGRFICMLVRNALNGGMFTFDYNGMIILDLIGKEDLAAAMAEKLDHVHLQEKFIQVYTEIISHPEKHNRFRLVVGRG